jgi:hypothetical protein
MKLSVRFAVRTLSAIRCADADVMTPQDSISAVRALLSVVDGVAGDDDEALLASSLHRVAASTTGIQTAFDQQDWPEPPVIGYSLRRERIVQRFPQLGYYNIAANICGSAGASEVNVGDAVDDLADIVGDLADVLWRWENTSQADALWHMQLSYRQHWGAHLRALQLHLYERLSTSESTAQPAVADGPGPRLRSEPGR